MKAFARRVAAFLLALAARGVLARYKPKIVMITGSVGKTSAKDAVAEALSARYLVRKSEKSLNSEFGVPFTILGVANPWDNPLAWLVVARRALALLILPNHYPNLLVLEVGADHPGDLGRIVKIAKPSAVVVTRLPDIPVHVEFYESPEAVRQEEFVPAYALPAGAPLVMSADDENALELAPRTWTRFFTFGTAVSAMVRLSDMGWYEEGGAVRGMQALLVCGGEREPIVVRGAVGKTQLLPLAAAVACALAFEVSFADAVAFASRYEPPPGRGRLFSGKNSSTLIDDTYNASPAAVEEALETLAAMPGRRKIAVLGDMLELGRYSVMEHERIGELATAKKVDVIVTVGIRSKGIAEAAEKANGKRHVLSFDDSSAAAAALPEMMKAGDVVLIKGSQSMRMERITEALLADPGDREQLVRQESAWKKR